MPSRVRISWHYYGLLTYGLPWLALFSCVGLSLLKDFEASTRTHCNVSNFLPSISVAIDTFEPQRYIWRFCFAFNSILRYSVAYLRLLRLLNRQHIALSVLYPFVQIINNFIHFLELTLLLLLTYIGTNENGPMHKWSYIYFVFCSLLHMLLTILIDYFWPRTSNFRISDQEKIARARRLKWFILHIMSFAASIYFYFRHNDFCEPYMYSIYALCEYFVVLTNIAYHYVVKSEWDMKGGHIKFSY